MRIFLVKIQNILVAYLDGGEDPGNGTKCEQEDGDRRELQTKISRSFFHMQC